MKMSLAEIKQLIDNDNIVFNQIPTSEGQVTDVIFQRNFQGLQIPVLVKAPYMGLSLISCGTTPLYVVKVSEKYYEIHNSKTAYLRFVRQK